MKQLLLPPLLVICFLSGFAQNGSNIQPIKLELVGDPPYPRINQEYNVGINLSSLRDSLYRSYIRQNHFAKASPYFFNEQIPIFTLDSLKKGMHVIGPLNFVCAGINFTTNKLTFLVDDSIPVTNSIVSI